VYFTSDEQLNRLPGNLSPTNPCQDETARRDVKLLLLLLRRPVAKREEEKVALAAATEAAPSLATMADDDTTSTATTTPNQSPASPADNHPPSRKLTRLSEAKVLGSVSRRGHINIHKRLSSLAVHKELPKWAIVAGEGGTGGDNDASGVLPIQNAKAVHMLVTVPDIEMFRRVMAYL